MKTTKTILLALAMAAGMSNGMLAMEGRAAPNKPDSKGGDTALHIAAAAGNLEKVEILLKYGADPTIKNNEGQTPADYGFACYARLYKEVDWKNPKEYLVLGQIAICAQHLDKETGQNRNWKEL